MRTEESEELIGLLCGWVLRVGSRGRHALAKRPSQLCWSSPDDRANPSMHRIHGGSERADGAGEVARGRGQEPAPQGGGRKRGRWSAVVPEGSEEEHAVAQAEAGGG